MQVLNEGKNKFDSPKTRISIMKENFQSKSLVIQIGLAFFDELMSFLIYINGIFVNNFNHQGVVLKLYLLHLPFHFLNLSTQFQYYL